MPKYFFNIVLSGQPTADATGRNFPDEDAARAHAVYVAMLLSDPSRDQHDSFIAVSGPDGRLVFKVPFPEAIVATR